MKTCGNYCYIEDEYDIDHIINQSIDETRKFVDSLIDLAKSTKDAKAILSAIIQIQIEELARIK